MPVQFYQVRITVAQASKCLMLIFSQGARKPSRYLDVQPAAQNLPPPMDSLGGSSVKIGVIQKISMAPAQGWHAHIERWKQLCHVQNCSPTPLFLPPGCSLFPRVSLCLLPPGEIPKSGVGIRPISLLRISLLRFVDSNFPGNSLWTWEFHRLKLRLCLSQTLWNPESWYYGIVQYTVL